MKTLLRTLSLFIALALLPACNIPSWLTYTNPTHQFQFQYPPGSTIESDTPNAARIQLPITAGTNLVEKYLDVSAVQGAIPCLSPYSDAYGLPPGVATFIGTQVINEISWVVEGASEGAAGSFYQWTAYSTYHADFCISLTFVLHSTNPGVYDTPPPTFSQPAESAAFASIVGTFTFLGGPPPTPTSVPSATGTTTATLVPTSTRTPTPTRVSSSTRTPTPTRVSTSSRTPTPTRVSSSSRTPTPTRVSSSSRTPTPTRVSSSSSTPTPTRVSSSSRTSTPTRVAFFFIPNLNLYCRLGPDPIFESITLAMKGVSYPIDGRNLRNTWLYILVPPGFGCWVPRDAGTPSGDTSLVRVLKDVPTPTFTPPPLSCSQFVDEKSCERHPECTWNQQVKACQNP